jgi:hypothetical protein
VCFPLLRGFHNRQSGAFFLLNDFYSPSTDEDPSPTEDEDAPSMVPGTIFKNAFNAADVEADDDEDDDEEGV